VPDSLQEKLDFFEHSLPVLDEFSNMVFKERSYTCILSGLNRVPQKGLPLIDFVGKKEGYERIEEIRRNTARLVEVLPSHYEYIKWLYENSNNPTAALR
jgi:hypothetical protein